MADNLDAKLNNWTALAGDDVDLRTPERRIEAAKRRAILTGISFEEALSQVTGTFERRSTTGVGASRTAGY